MKKTIPPAMPGAPFMMFERSEDSPFPDGYSIENEEAALQDLLAADDPDPLDPRYPRLELLEQRKRDLAQMRAVWKLRQGAEKAVPDNEAMRLRELGALVDESEDSMQLHTKEAFRLFMGRARDADGRFDPIIGGKRIASSLKSLWFLSGNNNPYADWALLRHTHHADQLRQQLTSQTDEYLRQMELLAARGLKFSVLRSAEPKEVALGFRSPYGYAVADLIVQYDYFVRVVKTLVRKDRFTDAQGYDVIRSLTRRMRASFEEIARFERFLMKPELRALSRADFLPGADGEAAKRAEAVKAIFGPAPADIFAGKAAPRHSRRRAELSDQEVALLERIAMGQEADLLEQKGGDEKGLV